MRALMKLPGWLLATLTLLLAGECWGAAAQVLPTIPDSPSLQHVGARWPMLFSSTWRATTSCRIRPRRPRWPRTARAFSGWEPRTAWRAGTATIFAATRPIRPFPARCRTTWVKRLHTDSFGRLWIATNSGGLARYDRDHDRFVTYPAGPSGLSNASLRDIVDDGAGGVWVATDEGWIICTPIPAGSTICVTTALTPAVCPTIACVPCFATATARCGSARRRALYVARRDRVASRPSRSDCPRKGGGALEFLSGQRGTHLGGHRAPGCLLSSI